MFNMFGTFSTSLIIIITVQLLQIKILNMVWQNLSTSYSLAWKKTDPPSNPKSNQRVSCFDVNCDEKASQTGFWKSWCYKN